MEMSPRPKRRELQSLNEFPVIIYGRFVEMKIICVLLFFFSLEPYNFTIYSLLRLSIQILLILYLSHPQSEKKPNSFALPLY